MGDSSERQADMISRQIGATLSDLQRARVGGLQAVDDLRLALGAEDHRAFALLDSPTSSASAARRFSSASSSRSTRVDALRSASSVG
jgi:hypothetical protein